jgi:heptose I phosphotransferase
MQLSLTDRFHAKQGRSTGRLVLETDDGQRLVVYLKRHFRLPWWRGLMALIRPRGTWSPGLQEWEHLQWAQAHGLPAPHAVAAGEYIGPWGRLQSFLAIEELTDMVPLDEAVLAAASRLDAAIYRRWKRGLVAEMARVVRVMHERKRFHQDLYLCHFFIPENDTRHVPEWPGRVHLIDFHRLTHHAWAWRHWQAKDLGQLLWSSEIPGVDVRDRLRFWRHYLGGGRGGMTARWLRRLIQIRSWNYRRHNRKTG